MRIKPGVSLRGVRPETVVGMLVADEGVDITITSVTEGTHKRASAHYTGRAFDVRLPTPDMAFTKEHLAARFSERLGAEWDVVLEADHIHVEFDPKGPS